MSAHTKGPWTYGVRDDGSIWLSLGDFNTGPHFQGDLVASEDDARLICAAPELLEACESARSWLAGWASADPYIDILEAAIAKAKGEA